MKWKRILGIIAITIIVLIVIGVMLLKSYDFNSLKPMISKFVQDATGRELVFGGDIDLEIGLIPSLVVKDVSFQNAEWGSRPDLLNIGRFEAQVKLIPLLKKNIIIKRLVMIEPDIFIETDKSGKSNLEFDKKTDTVKDDKDEHSHKEKDIVPVFAFNELIILQGRFTYKDGKSGISQVFGVDRFKAFATGIDTPIKVDINGSYNSRAFSVEGEVGPLVAMTDPEMFWPLDINLKAGGATIAAKGGILNPLTQKGIDIDFEVRGDKFQDLGRFAGVSLPLDGTYDIAGKAKDLSAKFYRLSGLKVSLGEISFAGDVEVSLSGRRPRIKMDITSEGLDFRPLFPKKDKLEGAPQMGVKKEKVFPDEPLNMESLKVVDLDARLRAKQILLPQLAFNNTNVALVLRDGQLGVLPIKGSIGGGAFDGRLSISQQGGTIKLSSMLKANSLDLGAMLKELNVSDLLEGDLDFDIDLVSRGASVAQLMAQLNGSLSAVMGGGRINNKYINLIGADLRSSVFRLLNPLKKQEDYTEINCFVVRFDIVDGIAESTAIVFDTDQMSVFGEGEIDLRNESINIALKPSPKKGIGEGTKISLSLSELAKPFKLGGTLAKPSLAVDPTLAVITIGKAVGGVAAFGPAGILSALVSRGQDIENPCLAAIESAETGAKMPSENRTDASASSMSQTKAAMDDGNNVETGTGDIKKGIMDVEKKVKDIGSDLKRLLGK